MDGITTTVPRTHLSSLDCCIMRDDGRDESVEKQKTHGIIGHSPWMRTERPPHVCISPPHSTPSNSLFSGHTQRLGSSQICPMGSTGAACLLAMTSHLICLLCTLAASQGLFKGQRSYSQGGFCGRKPGSSAPVMGHPEHSKWKCVLWTPTCLGHSPHPDRPSPSLPCRAARHHQLPRCRPKGSCPGQRRLGEGEERRTKN
nr:uncharacterized protein LOC129482521 isoform X1 [Symphalangus syndactylus]XP_055134441.1 uncharacterized protein LOC129482521 isoform X1 [Symphalangus syndactylus]XP_055134442.1 uncharacterized protein LOC129482521 isoform X1 [Symphalangus syndactylus]XP_055134443.1 uncharacterized protein LOC129482521 isoform X1 [Symphalangus syndactylus]